MCSKRAHLPIILRVIVPARRGTRVHLEHGECEMENSKTES